MWRRSSCSSGLGSKFVNNGQTWCSWGYPSRPPEKGVPEISDNIFHALNTPGLWNEVKYGKHLTNHDSMYRIHVLRNWALYLCKAVKVLETTKMRSKFSYSSACPRAMVGQPMGFCEILLLALGIGRALLISTWLLSAGNSTKPDISLSLFLAFGSCTIASVLKDL